MGWGGGGCRGKLRYERGDLMAPIMKGLRPFSISREKPIRVSSEDPTHIAEGPGIDLGEFNDLPLLLENFLTIDAEGGLRLCLESRRLDLPVTVPARSK